MVTLLSPHFGDESDVEERALVAERADELVAEASEASYQDALAELAGGPKVSDFVPPLPPQKCGRGGSRGYWAAELAKPIRVQPAPRTQGPRWPTEAPSDRWLEGRKTAEKVAFEVKARRELLAADDAEVREHAQSDVPETIVTLLETQLEQGERKAPKGVVAALAHARLEAAKNAQMIPSIMDGFTTLEQTVHAA